MWYLMLLLMFKGAVSEPLTMDDKFCSLVCDEIDMQNKDVNRPICQRGCNFYISREDFYNFNTTIKECHLSCNETYLDLDESKVCITGCNAIASKKSGQEIATFILITSEDEDSNNIVLAEPELEILETDFLSDPSIKSQLEIGFNIDYKIPETHIRTMPIEFKGDEIIIKSNNDYSGDWLDCASRNSGIPRWILLTAFLSGVLVALWLSFSAEKKISEESDDFVDDKLINAGCSDEKDPELLKNEEEIGYSMPPKYTLESEKV